MQSTDHYYDVKDTCVGYVVTEKLQNGSFEYVGRFDTQEEYMNAIAEREKQS